MRPYVVHDVAGLLRAAGVVLVGVVLVGGVSGVVRGHHATALGFTALWVALSVPVLRRAWVRLRVDVDGIAVSMTRSAWVHGSYRGPEQRVTPWCDVRAIEVDAAGRVRVELRSDVALPSWLPGRIHDPRLPQAGPAFERDVPGLDPRELGIAVRSFAPHVSLSGA